MLDAPEPSEARYSWEDIVHGLRIVLTQEKPTQIHRQPVEFHSPCSDEQAAEKARIIYRRRRLRSEMFSSGLFGEAAWDMLLDLYIHENVGRKVSITSATIASAQPPTTALRWLTVLESEGLIYRYSDPNDGRRTWVHLTEQGRSTMKCYLDAI